MWAKFGEKGDKGETGKIGNVVYPAGEYDELKVYSATDKKSPYVVDPLDGEYYMLKENNKYVGKKEYYSIRNGLNNEPLYNMFCIDPDDATADNSQQFLELSGSAGQRITIQCDDPSFRNTFIQYLNGKKYGYVKLNVLGLPNKQTKVLKKYYTLDSIGENLIVASKYIYSVDGVSETWIQDMNQSPSENALSENPLWEKFESFEALYAKIAMIDNGTIGSAVYSGDYMFSKQGVDSSGTTIETYQNFNKDHIYDSSSTFKPKICMNFNTGQMWAACGNIELSNNGDINMNGNINMDGGINLTGDINMDGNITIGGDLKLNGFFKRIKTEITSSNYNNYITTTNNLTYIDIKKCGTYIHIKSLQIGKLMKDHL